MKKLVFFALGIAVILSFGSCTNTTKTEKVVEKEVIDDGHDHDTMHENESNESAMLCGSCGQIKGSDKCCVEGVEDCAKCGLDKDSPGCCKITEDTKLCSHCGEIAGSDDCCKDDAVICEKCGLQAGSPGCCKI